MCSENAASITDNREGYPLDLDETVEIARMLKVRHPRLKGQLMVMTVDFFQEVTTAKGVFFVARDFKPTKELCKKRTLEKFEIVRRYYAARNIDYGIVTELDVPEICWRNVNWLHPRRDIDSLYPLTPVEVRWIGSSLSAAIFPSKEVTLTDICSQCDSDLRLDSGTSLAVARFMLANKAWIVDMRSKLLEPTKPMLIHIGDLESLWSRVCRTDSSA